MDESYIQELKLKDKIKEKFAFLKNPHSFFYYVLTLIGVGFAFFGYALMSQKFTTPYGGDFAQQTYQFYYNFYDDWWTFFTTGQFPFYDSNTFLGADNIFANTYYGLFSPFTFPILFVPRSFIPQMMSLISIARLVTGGLFFRIYLKYLGASEPSARIFSIAYAFTGWMAYYLWFNCFYEVLTFFPLILFGIEKVLKEKQILFLFIGFFCLGISNYFFLLTIGIFGVIYAGFRYFQTLKSRDLKDNLLVIAFGFLGFLFGIGLSMFCVFPALISSFSINRAQNAQYFEVLKASLKEGDYNQFFKIFFTCWSSNITSYGSNYEDYYYSFLFPLCSYFYPTISDRFTNIMHYRYFENVGSSIFLYTPSMILMGCSIYRSIKHRKISHFIAMAGLIFALFVPFFYFLCGSFVTAYGRWEIVVSIAALTYIALNFDHRDEVNKWVVIISGAITFALMLMTYFISQDFIKDNNNFVKDEEIIILVVYQLILTVVETSLFAGLWKKKHLVTVLKSSYIIEIVVVGTLVANIHSLQSISYSVGGGFVNVPTETRIIDNIKSNDDSYFRLSTSRLYESNANIGQLENFNSLGTFHSFYNNEVDDFMRFSQVLAGDTSWSGTMNSKRVNLDAFLGVKYYLSKDSDTTYTYKDDNGNTKRQFYEPNIPLNYERIDSDDDGYHLYKNKYQINFATSLDTIYFKNSCACSVYNSFYPYYSGSEFVLRNEEAYFNGAILDNDDVYDIMSEYGDNFNYEEAPSNSKKNAKAIGLNLKGIYAPYSIDENNKKQYRSFNPLTPDRDIVDEYKIADTSSSDAPVNRYQIVLEPSTTKYFPLGKEGSAFYLDYPVRSSNDYNYNATIYLIGEDENGNSKTITYDNFMNVTRNSARSMRGLYSKEKIKRIIIKVDGNKFYSSPSLIRLYYEPFEDCISRYQNAIDNGVKNVTYNVNKFTFTTNYDKPRFVVSQLAYTGGWQVYATVNGETTQLKVYNAQGGFAGFIAPEGEVSYLIKYETPHLKTGVLLSAISFIAGGGVSALGFILLKKKKKIN